MSAEISLESVRRFFPSQENHWLSPDKSREFLLLESPKGVWALMLSNLGYFDHLSWKGQPQRSTVLALYAEPNGQISIGLDAMTSPNSRSIDNFRYSPDGRRVRGNGSSILRALIPQLNKGLPVGASLPIEIDVPATAARFFRQTINGDFGNPVLVLPDGSIFQAPLPAAE